MKTQASHWGHQADYWGPVRQKIGSDRCHFGQKWAPTSWKPMISGSSHITWSTRPSLLSYHGRSWSKVLLCLPGLCGQPYRMLKLANLSDMSVQMEECFSSNFEPDKTRNYITQEMITWLAKTTHQSNHLVKRKYTQLSSSVTVRLSLFQHR